MTREDQFALDLANGVGSLRDLLAEYAEDVLSKYLELTYVPDDVPVIITASDSGAAAEKN